MGAALLNAHRKAWWCCESPGSGCSQTPLLGQSLSIHNLHIGERDVLGMFTPASLVACWACSLKSAWNVESSSRLVEP